MDGQTIGFIIALIAILVNIGALAWNIRKTSLQNTETKKLAETTAQLDSRVHRLSVNLDQRIVRLNRLNDLIRGAYLSNMKLNRAFWFNEVGLGKGSDTSQHYLHIISLDELTKYHVTVEGSFVEMHALARVIGDSDLLDLIFHMRSTLPDLTKVDTVEERKKDLQDFEISVTAVHEKVYRLLAESTESI